MWDFWALSHEGLRVGPGHCVGGAIPQGLLRLAFWQSKRRALAARPERSFAEED